MPIAPDPDFAARIYVESWSPEYGAPLDLSEESEPAAPVHPEVETSDWRPIRGVDLNVASEVAFVDGVRRIEARITVDDPVDGPVPGIMAAFGVGAVQWQRDIPRSTFSDLSVERMVVMARGYNADMSRLGNLRVSAESVPGDDPADLLSHLQRRMRAAEQSLASGLISSGRLVVADGRNHEVGPRPIVGFVKTHQVMYLNGEHRSVIGELRAGERTPLFLIDTRFVARYSWYLRLADLPWGHSWTGIVRCEVPTAVGVDTAVELADSTTALLPTLASERHIDPRAPQNLVPISALERELRRRMGDRNLAHRALLGAVHGRRPVGVQGGS
ncbi:MAG: hypothetical protein OXF41_21100 [bacterium]|nr:hypothetical protein [bacterium]